MNRVPKATDLESDAFADPDPLPRGRHKLSLEAVRANQRQRLLRAMLESVAGQGYEATTVPQVVSMARASRTAFYELFSDKLDCFLALCDELSEQLLEQTFDIPVVSDWRAAVREGAVRYLAWWAARPMYSRTYLVELPIAGARALEHRTNSFHRFAERFELVAALARQQEPDLAPLRPGTTQFLSWGIGGLVTAEVAAGRAEQLPALEDQVVWLIERLLAEPAG